MNSGLMNAGRVNDRSSLRRVAATLTIGSFSLAALMGIAALLGATPGGDTEWRVLLTTLVVGCASICVLCYLGTAGTRWQVVGAVGGLVVVLPTVTALLLIWGSWDDNGGEKLRAFGVGVVLAVSLAQVCLLLALAGSRPTLRLVLGATVLMVAVVATVACAMILGGTADAWQLLGITAILDVLGTLVTIALAKFVRADEPVRDGRILVTFTGDQAIALERVARRAGSTPAQVAAAAVDAYLLTQA